jgi:hypothetical protein
MGISAGREMTFSMLIPSMKPKGLTSHLYAIKSENGTYLCGEVKQEKRRSGERRVQAIALFFRVGSFQKFVELKKAATEGGTVS